MKKKTLKILETSKVGDSSVKTTADLNTEYISAVLGGYANALRTLPRTFDKLTREFGLDVYENMMMDDEVVANIDFLISACTAQDGYVIPAVDQDHKDYDKALEIAKFIGRCLDNMQTPVTRVNEHLMGALPFGSSVLEIIYKYQEDGEDKGKIVVEDIKEKNIRNYAAVVDKKNNLIGYMDTSIYRHGTGPLLSSCATCESATYITISADNGYLENVIPASKFLVFVWKGESGDPRGSSILGPAYAPWWLKQQAWKLWIEWAGKYAQPSFWATPPENAEAVCDLDGNEIEPTIALLQEGLKFQNSTFAVFPTGTQINSLEVKSNGEAFDLLIESCNRAIRRAILNQSLATAESSHNSRSAAGVHQDALGIKIIKIKNLLGECWRRSILKFLTISNFGAEYSHLVPKMDLGEGTGFPPSLSEVAQIMGTGRWELTEEQWARFEKKYNLPVRRKGEHKKEDLNGNTNNKPSSNDESNSGNNVSGQSNNNDSIRRNVDTGNNAKRNRK